MAEQLEKNIPLEDEELDQVTGGINRTFKSDTEEARMLRAGNCPHCSATGTVTPTPGSLRFT